MKRFLAILLALAMVFAFAACGSSDSAKTDDEGNADAAVDNGDTNTDANDDADTDTDTETANADFKIGVILLHNDQIGYDAAHIEGVKAAQTALGLADEQILWKYDIPENEKCYDAAVDLAEQGCNIIFADSFGHESYLFQAAAEYPDITFCHATGTTANASELSNVHNYFTKIYESRYVSGVVAGMKLKELMDSGEVTDPHVGYVGAYPYAEVKSGYTSFFLGVQSIVPEAYMDVMYTNSWADQTAEADAANALIAKGCVIISQHADTTGAPTAVQAALDSGKTVYCVGYNVDMLSAAPTAALTSAQNNWGVCYTKIITAAMNGEEIPTDTSVGYADNGVMISTLGPSCAEGTADKVKEVEDAIASGELHVFSTDTFTVNGEHLTSYDQSYGFEGTQLIWDGYFHESEVISAPLFDLVIDGITELN
jgi:basic membrane protein A and related proteins